jgi:hypothetical protein
LQILDFGFCERQGAITHSREILDFGFCERQGAITRSREILDLFPTNCRL